MDDERGGRVRSGAGRCLSVLGAWSRTGEMVFAGECPKDWPGQSWRPRYVDFTNVIEAAIESKARPGKCVGYNSWLGLFACHGQFGQRVSFDFKAPGQKRIMSSCLASGFVYGGISIGDCWDSPQLKWMLLEDGRIINGNAQCLEVRDENGRDVLRSAACTMAAEQQWIIRKQ